MRLPNTITTVIVAAVVVVAALPAVQGFIAGRSTVDGQVVENILVCCDVELELKPNEYFEHEVVFSNSGEVDQDGNVLVTVIPEGSVFVEFPSPVTVPAGDDLDIIVFIRAKGSSAPIAFTVHTDFDRID